MADEVTRLAVIDGDIVAYRCAAANEKRTVEAVHNDTAETHTFDTMTKFKEWCAASDLDAEDFTVTPGQEAGSKAFAFGKIKKMLEDITRDAGCDSYHVVVSGKENFRLDLPLPTRYKDSRKESVRPLQLAASKQYLVDHHDAEVSEGVEADDVLVGYAYQGHQERLQAIAEGVDEDALPRTVQCSLDKDAKHGPGWLYDWVNMTEAVLITGYGGLTLTLKETGRLTKAGKPIVDKVIKGTGRAFLWYQIVFGDPVDAYKPCELAKVKFGDVGAYELLKNAKNDKEALEAVVRQYKIWYPKPVTYRAWNNVLHTKSWLEIMQMYADCAFMRRWPGDRLDMEKLLKKLGVDYE